LPEDTVLSVRELKTYFYTRKGVVKAVDGVSFDLHKKEALGIVGESGSGKSMTCFSIMRLVPDPPGKIVGGEVLLNGQDLLKLSSREIRKIRGRGISMSFQDPMTYLNPVMRVGDQIAEAILLHNDVSKASAFEMAVEAMRLTEINNPEKRAHDYPHQLSGGMRQRILISMALACNPDVMIADEPTTALDVVVQKEILNLLRNLRNELSTGMIIVSHDLGVVAEVCEKVAVMYAGSIVEISSTKELFENPLHPYTIGLMESIPRPDRGKQRLLTIPGSVPDLINPPSGCKFHPRCPYAVAECKIDLPRLEKVDGDRYVRCIKYAEIQKTRRS
jgi:peptide/nickel transport system ATP-binding protein/oligopeptide transport system ATP-binding protein